MRQFARKDRNMLGTLNFLTVLNRLWRVWNVKSSTKGQRKKDDLSSPIRSMADTQVGVLRSCLSWFQSWPADKHTGLTSETRGALIFTLKGMLAYLEQKLVVEKEAYVMLGQLMSDPIEGYFGQVCLCWARLSSAFCALSLSARACANSL